MTHPVHGRTTPQAYGDVIRNTPRYVPIADQPPPAPNTGPAIADLVIADMTERKAIGIQRYGTPLQAHNGRDALIDAYQEALDLCCYLRQAIEERAVQIQAGMEQS